MGSQLDNEVMTSGEIGGKSRFVDRFEHLVTCQNKFSTIFYQESRAQILRLWSEY